MRSHPNWSCSVLTVSQLNLSIIDKTEVTVNNYKGDPAIKGCVEVRGIVNKDGKTLSFGQLTDFGESFGKTESLTL